MHRRRRSAALLSLLSAVVAGPVLASAVLAADPTVIVQPGDTLTGISRRHGVSIARLVELNALANPNRIRAGQRLRLAAGAPASGGGSSAPASAAARTHTVRAGEHLTGIARHYGVTIAAIVSANRLADPSRIYAGQRLSIPGGAPSAAGARSGGGSSAPAAAAARTHTVRAGEHLTGIARHYGVTIAAIVSANRLADPSRIYAGQRLSIPGGAPSGGGTSPSSAAPDTSRMPASMAALVTARDGVRRSIVQHAGAFGVPRGFALAVAWQESGWQQQVVSHAGAIGVMQLMPDTARWVGETMLRTSVDPRDTGQNIRAGVRLLAHYLQRYDGNWDLALAAYYQGQTAVDRHGIYGVSRPYIASIKALAELFDS